MLNVAHLEAASNLARWPGLLHPNLCERAYYGERAASRAWVDGLQTRGGIPRWDRIRKCGDPVAVVRISDGACAWQHKWCRDRACYACARSRSRKLATSLRTAVVAKPHALLYFITLTRRRLRWESCTDAYRAFVREWERLRHTEAWAAYVVGGVRNMEVTFSDGHDRSGKRFPGWHVHAHLLVELRETGIVADCPTCDGTGKRRGQRCRTCNSATTQSNGTMPLAARAMLDAWCTSSNALPQAQCAVPLNRINVGQLAKYLTKLWELRPEKARELFSALAGKRIVEGFGTWRDWRAWGVVESTPHGWYPSGVPLTEIERMDPSTLVEFSAPLPGVTLVPDIDRRPLIQGVIPFRRGQRPSKQLGTAWRPTMPVAAMTAGSIVAAIRKDARPVWERVDEKPDGHAEKCAAVRVQLSQLARTEYRGHLANRLATLRRGLEPPPDAPWCF